jgi:hypothetical protein
MRKFIFAAAALRGKQPLCGQTMNPQFVKPAAIQLRLADESERFGWHRFRHSLSTWANETTKGITVSQTMLRHAKPDTTAIYTRELWGGVGRSECVHAATAADEARFGINSMIPSGWHRAENLASRTTSHFQMLHHLKTALVTQTEHR